MFLTRIKSDAGSDRSVFGNFFFQPVGGLSGGGVRVTAGSAMALPAVFACVRVLAESFASMPFKLYEPNAAGLRGPQIKRHWLYRLFAKAPNQFQTPYEWRLMLMGHLALRGNAFCQITANSKGEVIDLLPLHPDRMTIEMMSNGSYRYLYTDQFGKQIVYMRSEIWHLRGLSSDGIVGMSPIDMERDAIGEGLAMQSYSSRFFANDAKPGGGWIEYPGSFADKATKQTFRESWQEMQGGANRGKVAVLEKGMKFHEIGLNNKDSQFIEARAAKVTEVARIFRVPPHKIGDLTRSTNNNIESQSIEFWTDTMLPWAELWESSIEFFLLGPDSDFEPEFDMSRMMRGDSAGRSAYYNQGINSGWLTRNEARQAEGYDPIDGLDEPLRPLNMVEDSQASDELIEADGGADDAAKPTDAPDARFKALLAGNANRMARRIVGGNLPSAQLLSDALAISVQTAGEWLLIPPVGLNETQIAASLMKLAFGESE